MNQPRKRFQCLLLSMCAVCAALHAEENSANGPTPQQLVEQLNADDFDARKRAEAALEKLGDKARAALLQAAQSGNADVKASAAALLSKLSAATLRLHVYDRAGHPVAEADGELESANTAMDKQEAFPFKTAAGGIVELKLGATGTQVLRLKFKDWQLADGSLSLIHSHTRRPRS